MYEAIVMLRPNFSASTYRQRHRRLQQSGAANISHDGMQAIQVEFSESRGEAEDDEDLLVEVAEAQM